jgi:hypothetical protein
MVKYTPLQLTDSSTPYFLCRGRKDGQYLNHNLDDCVAHGPGRRDASIYLKPAEEMFDAAKAVDKYVLASARLFSHLCLLSK